MKNYVASIFAGVCAFFYISGEVFAQTEQGPALIEFELAGPPRQLSLVNGLREASGLAMASANSVYAHNDEFGIVYEVMLADGAVKSAFALGDPTVSADFEGVATEGKRIYLVTSTGLIYEALIGGHRSRVLYNVFNTGIGAFCEVEGLANATEEGAFLVLCKAAQVQDLQGKLTIYRWSLRDRKPVADPWLQVSYRDFLNEEEAKVFRPSAVEWDPDRKALVVLSARSRHLMVISEDGSVAAKKTLSADLHLQAEGVALAPSGDLIIADEGAGRGPGQLSVYTMRN
ncbi:MAG: SdiA-regulated domain-containing protein [Pseudomonadota bacterium]